MPDWLCLSSFQANQALYLHCHGQPTATSGHQMWPSDVDSRFEVYGLRVVSLCAESVKNVSAFCNTISITLSSEISLHTTAIFITGFMFGHRLLHRQIVAKRNKILLHTTAIFFTGFLISH